MKDVFVGIVEIFCGLLMAAGFLAFIAGAGCIDRPENPMACYVVIAAGLACLIVGALGINIINAIERR